MMQNEDKAGRRTRRALVVSREDFLYDVSSLYKSFYPDDDCQILTGFDEKNKAEDFDEVMTLDCPTEGDKKLLKREVCRKLYRKLSQRTGRDLPWGTLSGVRPTKIPMKGLNEGRSEEEIRSYMKETYLVSDKKIDLAVEIAKKEKSLIDRMGRGVSLYVGIPFCPSICSYCTFSSSPISRWESRIDDYLEALEKEMRAVRDCLTEPVHTIYIGGGTPTSLPPRALSRLLDAIDRIYPTREVMEYTIEAGRPDTLTKEKLAIIRDHPIDRISVNPQTMNARTLKKIGRAHSPEETIRAFHAAREAGFDNINMDLIMGLPDEGIAEISHTLEEIGKLGPDSLTVHSLALKRASRLTAEHREGEDIFMKNSEAVMNMASEAAKGMGLEAYYMYRQKNMRGSLENVGYARPGKESLYNILIMEETESILACGAGASTKAVHRDGFIERLINPKDVINYMSRIDEMIEKKTDRSLWDH